MVLLDARLTGDQEVIGLIPGFDPYWGGQHSFMAIDQGIFTVVILSLSLIQEGQEVYQPNRDASQNISHRMTDSVDPDEMAFYDSFIWIYTAYVSFLVVSVESIKLYTAISL